MDKTITITYSKTTKSASSPTPSVLMKTENKISLIKDIPNSSIQSSNVDEPTHCQADTDIPGDDVKSSEIRSTSNDASNPAKVSTNFDSDVKVKFEKIPPNSLEKLDLESGGFILTNETDGTLMEHLDILNKSGETLKKVSKIIIKPAQNTDNESSKVVDPQIMQSLGMILYDRKQCSQKTQLQKLNLNQGQMFQNFKLLTDRKTKISPVAIQPRPISLLKSVAVDSSATQSTDKTMPVAIQPRPISLLKSVTVDSSATQSTDKTMPVAIQPRPISLLKSVAVDSSATQSIDKTIPVAIQPRQISLLKSVAVDSSATQSTDKTIPVAIQPRQISLLNSVAVDSSATQSTDKTTSQLHTKHATFQESCDNVEQEVMPSNSGGPHFIHHGQLVIHSPAINKISTSPSPGTTSTFQVTPAKTVEINSIINNIIKYSNTNSSSVVKPHEALYSANASSTITNCTQTTMHLTLGSGVVTVQSSMAKSPTKVTRKALPPRLSLRPVIIQSSQSPSMCSKTGISNVRKLAIQPSLTSVSNLAIQPSIASKNALSLKSVLSTLETEPITITDAPPQQSTPAQILTLPITPVTNTLKQSHQASQSDQTPRISQGGNKANNVNQANHKKKWLQIVSPSSRADPMAANLLAPPTTVKQSLPNGNVRPNIISAPNGTYFYISSTSPATITTQTLAQSSSRIRKIAFLAAEPVQSNASKPIVFTHQAGSETSHRTQDKVLTNSPSTVISSQHSASTPNEQTVKKTPPKMILLMPKNTNEASLGTLGSGALKSSLLRYKVSPAAASKSILNSFGNPLNSVQMMPCAQVIPNPSLTSNPVKNCKRTPRQHKIKQYLQNLDQMPPSSIASHEPKGVFVTSLRTGQGLVPVRLLFPDMGDGIDETPDARDDVVTPDHTKTAVGITNVKQPTNQCIVNENVTNTIHDKISTPSVSYICIDASDSENDSDIEQSLITEEQDIRLLNTLLTSATQSHKPLNEVTVYCTEEKDSVSSRRHDFTITGSRIGGLQGVSDTKQKENSVPNVVEKDVLNLKTSIASSCNAQDENVEKTLNSTSIVQCSQHTPNIEKLNKDNNTCINKNASQENQHIQEIINNNEEPEKEDNYDLKIESVYSLKDHLHLDHFKNIANMSEDKQDESFDISLSNDWKQISMPCFVVLERLSKYEIQCMGSTPSRSRCSTHCRKRTLDYLCKLNLISCNNLTDMASVSPPRKVQKMCEPDTRKVEITSLTKENPDPSVNLDPCVAMDQDTPVAVNPDSSFTEVCAVPATTQEARSLIPSPVCVVGNTVTNSPQDVQSPSSKAKLSHISDHELPKQNVGFQKLLKRLKKQVEQRRKQLRSCKKCQKKNRRWKKALEQRHPKSAVSRAPPAEKTPEYDHSVMNKSGVILSQARHSKSLGHLQSSPEKKIRKTTNPNTFQVEKKLGDMKNVSSQLRPLSVPSQLNLPTASTSSRASVVHANDVSKSPASLAPLIHSVTINPFGQIIERTPHISQNKVENALKSLIKYLVTTGRKPTMDDNHYFLLKIDNQHVLVKIPSGSLPPLQTLNSGSKNPQQVNKTNRAPAAKTNIAATAQTIITATPQTKITATPQTIFTATPQTKITATPQTIFTATPQTKITATPQTIFTATPQTKITATPQTIFTATPQTIITATPQTIFTATPQTIITATPQTIFTATPQTKITATPQTIITATPQTKITATPQTKITATPQTIITATPQTKITATPQTKITATPQTIFTATPQTIFTATPQTIITATPETKITNTPQTIFTATPQTSSSAALKRLLTMASDQVTLSHSKKTNNSNTALHQVSSSPMPKMVMCNSEFTGTCILPQSQRSVTLMKNSRNRSNSNTIKPATIPQPPQLIPPIVNCDYGDSRSILSHLPPDSTLLPSRRKTMLKLTQDQLAVKRQKLKQKYPLPPGVVIKSEPDDFEYALDENWTVTSEISMSTTVPSSFVSDLISAPRQEFAGEQCVPLSSSVAQRYSSLEASDDPPCLTDETFGEAQQTPHTIESENDPTDELPPVLQPMFTTAPTSAVDDHDMFQQGKDASVNTSKLQSKLADVTFDPLDAPQALEAVASVSSSSLISDKSYESHDSGYNTETQSSIGISSAFVNKPVYKNSKIERLKELLKKKEMEIETMRKRQSEIPMLDLDTV